MHNKNIVFIALVVGHILLALLLINHFSESFDWSPFDFVFAGALLFGVGVAFELIWRVASTLEYRAAAGAALVGVFLLVWINQAVGIIGSEDNPANRMYFGVLAVLLFGALIALLRPRGMARALFATALAHGLVAVIALIILPWNLEALKTLALNGFFVALWTASAVLFRQEAAAWDKYLP